MSSASAVVDPLKIGGGGGAPLEHWVQWLTSSQSVVCLKALVIFLSN